MKRMFWLVGLISALLLPSCKKDLTPKTENPPLNLDDVKPLVTEKGTPSGQPSTASIGSEGGSITSADGKLTVTFPSGALAETTEVGIQPVTNLSPLGLALGYRLSPEGTVFSQPVTLTFRYTSEDLGTAIEDFLWITTQNADGTWSAAHKSVVDKAAKTVTVQAKHFSDWSLGRFVDLLLIPNFLNLPVGKMTTLSVAGFLRDQQNVDEEDVLQPLSPIGFELAHIDRVADLLDRTETYVFFSLEEWTLNGSKGPVSNAFGKLEIFDNTASFIAPEKRPTPSTVAVTVKLVANRADGTKPSFLLTSNITIVDSEYYLKVKAKGQDYTYIEYGFNGQAPDGNDFQIVNFGRNSDGSVAMGAAYLSGGQSSNTFALTFDHHGVGFRTMFCTHSDEENHDNMVFTPGVDPSASLINSYYQRKKGQDLCDELGLCAGMSININSIEGDNEDIISGTFSGDLYNSPDGYEKACKTDDSYPVSGAFHLKLAN